MRYLLVWVIVMGLGITSAAQTRDDAKARIKKNQERLERLEALFPDAPAGWEASKISYDAKLMDGPDEDHWPTHRIFNRHYTQKQRGGQTVHMQVLNSAGLIDTFGQMNAQLKLFSNPDVRKEYAASGVTVKAVDMDEWTGGLYVLKNGEGEVILTHGATLLRFKCSKTNVAMLESFLEKMTLECGDGICKGCDAEEVCNTCNGTGGMKKTCPTCRGAGRVGNRPCMGCGTTGVVVVHCPKIPAPKPMPEDVPGPFVPMPNVPGGIAIPPMPNIKCGPCGGSGYCGTCGGHRYTSGANYGAGSTPTKCMSCGGTGRCRHCR